MTIENGRPFTPGLPADRWQASAGRTPQAGVYHYVHLSISSDIRNDNRSCTGLGLCGDERRGRSPKFVFVGWPCFPTLQTLFTIQGIRSPKPAPTKCLHLSDSSGPITLNQTKAPQQGQIFIWERPSLFRRATS